MLYNRLRFVFVFFVLIVVFSSCVVQKLSVTTAKMPERLGVFMTYSDYVEKDDYKYFISAVDSVIRKFNSEDHSCKLYISDKDSNSLCLDVLQNIYVGKNKQLASVFITGLGVVTPIFLITSGAPLIVAFWYLPKNSIQVCSYLSKDIDSTNNTCYNLLQTRHEFKDLNKQKEKQKVAYYTFTNNLLRNILLRGSHTEYSTSDYPHKVILQDGEELICRIIKTEDGVVHLAYRKNGNKEKEIAIRKDFVKSIERIY